MNRLHKIYRWIYNFKFETRNEVQLAYSIWQKQRDHIKTLKPYWESITNVLNKFDSKNLLQKLLNKKELNTS